MSRKLMVQPRCTWVASLRWYAGRKIRASPFAVQSSDLLTLCWRGSTTRA